MTGGASGLDRYESRLGATGETRYTDAFGAVSTSARDRTLVSLRLLRGGEPLQAPARATAWPGPAARSGTSAGATRPRSAASAPAAPGCAPSGYQPRSRHAASDGRSAPSVVSLPCPG